MKITDRSFFEKDGITLAKSLLGKSLVHISNGIKLSGRIVETEAYMGGIDKGSHAYNYKKTKRNIVMYNDGGIAYVYLIYGMYNCMNIVASKEGNPEAVLIRAIQPIDGIEYMAKLRYSSEISSLKKKQFINIANGPGKLCIALDIDRKLNGMDLMSDNFYVDSGECEKFEIASAKRINIDYAEEAKDYLWRFYIKGNSYVSVK